MILLLTLLNTIPLADTLVVKMQSTNSGSSSAWTPQLITGIVAALSAALGSFITIWFKKNDFRLQQLQLDQQRLLINETISNNENTLKAEVVKLKQLRKEYELSLNKFEFEQLDKVLDFALKQSDKKEKIEFLKAFSAIMKDAFGTPSDWIMDEAEYVDYISGRTYHSSERLKIGISQLLDDNPLLFMQVHKDLKKIVGEISYLVGSHIDIQSTDSEYTSSVFIEDHQEHLFKVYNDLNKIMETIKDEFSELEKYKKDFIRSKLFKSK